MSPSTAHPHHVKVDIPLVRSRDKRDLGTLSLIRDNVWRLHDDDGQRLVNPVLVDTLIVTLVNAKGEQVCWHQMPMESLLPGADDIARTGSSFDHRDPVVVKRPREATRNT